MNLVELTGAIVEQGDHTLVVYFYFTDKLLEYYVNINLEDLDELKGSKDAE